ncbi:hypothetical protein ACLKA7_014507 [Drosophila subpalustris]
MERALLLLPLLASLPVQTQALNAWPCGCRCCCCAGCVGCCVDCVGYVRIRVLANANDSRLRKRKVNRQASSEQLKRAEVCRRRQRQRQQQQQRL